MLRLATGLPDALVGVLPHLRGALGLRLDDRPEAMRQPVGHPRVKQDRVEHRPEDVVLALVEGTVADPDGTGAGVARELVERRLREIPTAVDPVHDLQRAVLGRFDVGHELHELVRLPVELQPVQRLQRERRVAHPGVAVVPVALPSRRLRQRRRQRGDRRAGGHVGQALDRECRALDRVPVAMVGNPSATEPRPPEPCRIGDPRRRIVDVGRRRELLGPGEGAERPLARPKRMAGADAVTPRCRVRDPRRGGSSGPRRLRRRGDGHRPRATTPRSARP